MDMNWTTGNPEHDNSIRTLLPRFSEKNRETTLRYLRVRSLSSKPGTLYNYAQLLCLLDDHLNGSDMRKVTADELLAFLLSERQRTSESTVVMRTRQLKRFLKDTRGRLPKEFLPILRTKEPPPPDRANIVSPDGLQGLLAACNDLRGPRWFDRTTQAQALLWFLWDTGFRIGEVRSVRFCDVTIEGDMVKVKLDPKSPLLKTGPRTIEVAECVPSLKAWMALHPNPAPLHPLWISTRRTDPPTTIKNTTADNLVKKIAGLAGLELKGDKPLSCHDFRHTSATRRARAGWGEADLRLFHGWTRDSMMPARYVHKNLDDLREMVRRDAGLTADALLSATVDAGIKECPMCAEEIKAAAKKCRHCGEYLAEQVPQRR